MQNGNGRCAVLSRPSQLQFKVTEFLHPTDKQAKAGCTVPGTPVFVVADHDLVSALIHHADHKLPGSKCVRWHFKWASCCIDAPHKPPAPCMRACPDDRQAEHLQADGGAMPTACEAALMPANAHV